MSSKLTTLYIDLGASRVKWLISNNVKNLSSGVLENKYITNVNYVEIDLFDLLKKIKQLIFENEKLYKISKVLFSSQMHGFVVSDLNNNFLSNYLSWKDQRFFNSSHESYKSIHNDIENSFQEITGMSIKSGLPFFNSIQLINDLKLKECKILSLPESILIYFGVKNPKVHLTIAAGQGFYDINFKTYSAKLIDIHKSYSKCNLFLNELSDENNFFSVTINSNQVDFSIGFGDHQCATLGSENLPNDIYLNLGTGSQVSIINKSIKPCKNNYIQTRPYFKNKFLNCVTHIPSGRVLNSFLSIFGNNVWKKIESYSIEDIDKSNLNFNLNIFEDSYSFENFGSITNIKESNFNIDNILKSMMRCYINQYYDLINSFQSEFENSFDNIILSGGIPKKINVIKEILKRKTNKNIIIKNLDYVVDDTIIGLQKINNL